MIWVLKKSTFHIALTSRTCSSLPPTSVRPFSKVTDSRPTEYYLEDIFGDEDPLEDLRNFMYPESEDQVRGRLICTVW